MIGAAELSGWDWAFVGWFLVVTTGVGLWYARRAGSSLSEYFLSGRNLPWWALGTSIVATTFAADTPIVIAGFVVSGGIAKNWLWWSFLFGGTLTVFLFARLWRRAEVFTEIELIAVRYDGRAARALRAFKAVFLGLVVNAIIFGFVTKAMAGVVGEVFDVPEWLALGVLILITLGYTAVSGLWGVVATDVLQFVMAMLGAVLLAVLAVGEVGGLGALVERVRELEVLHDRDFLSVFPTDWGSAFTASVVILVLVNWWAVYYPGAEPGGGGYAAQRMMAAIDERHARAGTLWFVFAHYVLRPWPWILVGLAAVVLDPGILDAVAASEPGAAERAYPSTFRLLPVGLLGLVVASFLAAFMSTITTTLNLSASYLVNDLYLPFFARGGESERERVRVARIAVAVVTVAGCIVSWLLFSAGDGWTMIMHLTAGSGLVLILRWLWWRVNAWSEIAAMTASAVTYTVVQIAGLGPRLAAATGGPAEELGLLLTVVITTVVWLMVTFATQPVGHAQLDGFYRRVRPGGWWGPVAVRTGIPAAPMRRDLQLWAASTVMVFGALIGVGSLLLGSVGTGVAMLVVAALSGAVVYRGLQADRGDGGPR